MENHEIFQYNVRQLMEKEAVSNATLERARDKALSKGRH
jgi:hypothetical protein